MKFVTQLSKNGFPELLLVSEGYEEWQQLCALHHQLSWVGESVDEFHKPDSVGSRLEAQGRRLILRIHIFHYEGCLT